jgi:ketosteroid isomerase-like protein
MMTVRASWPLPGPGTGAAIAGMTHTDPKQVVQRYLDALVAGDLDTVRESFAEDATWTMHGDLPIAGPWNGRDRIVDEFLVAVGELFEPGSQSFEFPTLIAEGETVALEWRVRARTARGGDYDNAYCGIFIVRDGRIRAVREYLDSGYAERALFAQAFAQ